MKLAIKRVGIIAKPKLNTVATVVSELTQWFAARQIDTVFDVDTAAIAGGIE